MAELLRHDAVIVNARVTHFSVFVRAFSPASGTPSLPTAAEASPGPSLCQE